MREDETNHETTIKNAVCGRHNKILACLQRSCLGIGIILHSQQQTSQVQRVTNDWPSIDIILYSQQQTRKNPTGQFIYPQFMNDSSNYDTV